MNAAAATVDVIPPMPPSNQPPVIGNIAEVFLENVPHDGDWFVTVAISDDNDSRSDLTISAQATSGGIGVLVSVTNSGIMIETRGLP